ncbi:MAG: PilW family protein [Halioglobus sp.]
MRLPNVKVSAELRAAVKSAEKGFSLVELVIAMGLGVFLSSVMVFSYVNAVQSGRYDEQVLFVQENARFALRFLSRELSLAGYHGALGDFHEIAAPLSATDCSFAGWSLDRSRPLQVVDDYIAGSSPVTGDAQLLGCLDSSSIEPATDLLTFRRSAAVASLRDGVAEQDLVRSATETWFLRAENNVAQRWEKSRPRDLPSLAASSSSSVSYWQAIARIVFVRPFSQVEGDGLPTLCMKTLAGTLMTTRCLVEGVENIQVEFGLDTDFDGVPNVYQSGLGLSEMHQAVTARIHLLVRSADAVSPRLDEKSYVLGAVIVPPPLDRYVRRVFSATVQLKNLAHGLG